MPGANRASHDRARAAALAALAVAVALALSGCGGGSRAHTHRPEGPAVPKAPSVVAIYASLPLHGPLASSAVPVLRGIKLALRRAGSHAGRFHVRLHVLDSSRAGAAAAAGAAATNPLTMLVIGGFTNSGSQTSAPVLSQAGIPEITPSATYVGLTQRIPGVTASGEPGIYAPSGARTFLRLIPSDAVEAAADLLALQQARCARLGIAHDGSGYGTRLAQMVALAHAAYGIRVVANAAVGRAVRAVHDFAETLKTRGAECLVVAGTDLATAVPLITEVHAVAMPTAPVLVTDRLCSPRLGDPAAGGLPPALDAVVGCTLPTLPTERYPGGRAFAAAYRAAFHGEAPGRYAIFGYEAMRVGLDTIGSLGSSGDSRSALVRALIGMATRSSVLGLYRFDAAGDSTLNSYGLYRIDPLTHALAFQRVLEPQHVP